MALSDTVKESLRDAQDDLRNALAAAARTEKPFVSKHIADMLAMIDTIIYIFKVNLMFCYIPMPSYVFDIIKCT